MQRFLPLAMLLAMCTLLPIWALAQNPGKGTIKIDENAFRTKLVAGAYIQGRLTAANVEGDERTFTVQYVHQIKRPNATVGKKLQDVLAQARQAYQAKDKNRLSKLKVDYDALMAAQFDIEEIPITFECTGDKSLVVRLLSLPEKLGDDGKIIKIPPEEEKKLKGDGKLPGYLATVNDLDPGQQLVRIYIDKAKLKPATPPPAKTAEVKPAEVKPSVKTGGVKTGGVKTGGVKPAAEPDKGTAKDKDEAPKLVYPVTMIMIVPPPKDSPAGNPAFNPFVK